MKIISNFLEQLIGVDFEEAQSKINIVRHFG